MNNIAIRKFTGWHMTAILVTFFGVVIAVNFTMARMAVSSFGGTVVDNSYVASQNYNRWLHAADQQERLGWRVYTRLDAQRHILVEVRQDGQLLTGIRASGNARHPLGRSADLALNFTMTTRGRLRSTLAMPPGRWNLQLSLRKGADIYKLREALP